MGHSGSCVMQIREVGEAGTKGAEWFPLNKGEYGPLPPFPMERGHVSDWWEGADSKLKVGQQTDHSGPRHSLLFHEVSVGKC